MALPQGMSVRAISQAKTTAMAIAGISRTIDKAKLIHKAFSVVASAKARVQLANP
jgi:hypothetical protein